MNRILSITIVTYNWPPRNAIGTHRPYSWAKYWGEEGHRIRVLTPKKYSYDAPLDLILPPLHGVDVQEREYANATGLAARMLTSTPFNGVAKKTYRLLREIGGLPTSPRDNWVAAFRPELGRLAADCDVVVSTFGPKGSHLLGAAMKAANPHLTWVADYRDLWSQNHTMAWSPARRDAERREELESVGRYADTVMTVSEDLARQLMVLLGKPTVVVTNGFDRSRSEIEAATRKRPSNRPGQVVRIVYTGKVYKGLQDPLPLLKVIAECEEKGSIPRGSVEVHFYGGQTEAIDELLRSGRFRHFLRSHGHVPREVALQAQVEADFLLLLESSEIAARGVLTGKIFEYIGACRPILCVGSRPEFEIGLLLARTATGKVVDSREIASTLVDRLHDGAAPSWYNPRIEEILRHSRQAQALAALEAIQRHHG